MCEKAGPSTELHDCELEGEGEMQTLAVKGAFVSRQSNPLLTRRETVIVVGVTSATSSVEYRKSISARMCVCVYVDFDNIHVRTGANITKFRTSLITYNTIIVACKNTHTATVQCNAMSEYVSYGQ